MAISTILAGVILHFSFASAQRIVRADLWKPDNPVTTSDLGTRQDPFAALLTQKPDKSMYWINITIGTPGQPQSIQLDTGSRNLWVPARGSAICSSSLVNCGSLGSFDKSDSSTYDTSGQSNTISYGDGSSVNGEFFDDTVRINGQAINNQQTTLATSGTGIHQGVLGVGWPASYPTVNHNLAAQGVIPSNQFSLWLDDVDSTTGTILFGGIDRSKFVAPLIRLPVVSANLPAVTLSRILTVSGGSSDIVSPSGFSETVILDTGTSLTVLPNAIATKIVNALGAQFYPSGATSGTTIIPCNQKPKNLSIKYQFGSGASGATINVDISQLVLRYLAPLNGIDMCQFGIYGSDGSYPTTLGDSFLRSAYVLYDVEDNQIGLAQSIVDGDASDVVELL